jgi:arylsulfatase A-like enzyme
MAQLEKRDARSRITRRTFLKAGVISTAAWGARTSAAANRPNILFVFADQWRAQATGYAGDTNVHTPNLDALAAESVNVRNAVSGCPVCSPFRASLLTGQYPHAHGVFLNDVPLRGECVTVAEVLRDAGYATGYIGKWHLDGRGRSNFIPPERRQGFDFWRVQECTHDYNESHYYADRDESLTWEEYDAFAQTKVARQYLQDHAAGPFALFLSWGPPHNPYETAPEGYSALYRAEDLMLRPNVPNEASLDARRDLAGYYAHCSALDRCVGDLCRTLDELELANDTILVFTSDHGDMLGSHGEMRKQRPWDESIRVPFLLRYPRRLGVRGRVTDVMLNSPDIAPTLLSLCGLGAPDAAQGVDVTPALEGRPQPRHARGDAALLACYSPFGEWTRPRGGREYRGIRTRRYTYIRTLDGPWLLYDNVNDPYQQTNLSHIPSYRRLRDGLDVELARMLASVGDEFLPGEKYVAQWGYVTDRHGTVPYTP